MTLQVERQREYRQTERERGLFFPRAKTKEKDCFIRVSLIAKVSLVGWALALGLDPRCSGRRLVFYRVFEFVWLFWS